jgi:hypothetical protein
MNPAETRALLTVALMAAFVKGCAMPALTRGRART